MKGNRYLRIYYEQLGEITISLLKNSLNNNNSNNNNNNSDSTYTFYEVEEKLKLNKF